LRTGPRRPKAAKSRTPSAARATVRVLLELAADAFDRAGLSYGHGTSNALEEASWLILHSLALPLTDLEQHLDDPVSATARKAILALVDKRIRTRKPAAYLLHEAWLGPHRFYVDERVIVPRSFIAEILGREAGGGRLKEPRSVLDLCTGSGCLAILAALQFPQARVDAADLSRDALAVARRNVEDYGLADRIRLVESDLFSRLGGRRYDLIISNPPYVKAASMRKLPEEYRTEPEMALASGTDGLDHTRLILADALRHLNPGGLLVVEIGHNRKALEKAFPKLPFKWPKTSAGPGYVFTLGV
jgi:ribosomal protein L3 glutamine methyltransferase